MSDSGTKWFLYRKKKEHGPFSVIDLAQQIRNKNIGPTDLIKSEYEESFKAAHLYEDFKLFFQFHKEKPRQDQWVILLKHDKKSNKEFQQIGPYSEEEINKLIHTRFISKNDYIWQDGMTAWLRIAKSSNFSSTFEGSASSPLTLVEAKEPSTGEEMRGGIDGEDLARQEVDFSQLKGDKNFYKNNEDVRFVEKTLSPLIEKKSIDKSKKEVSLSSKKVESKVERIKGNDSEFENVKNARVRKFFIKWNKKKTKITLSITSMIAILLSLLFIYIGDEEEGELAKYSPNYKKKYVKSEVKLAKTTSNVRPIKKNNNSKKNEIIEREKPSYIKLIPKRLSSGLQQLIINTDGSNKNNIYLYFYSRIGQLVGKKGFYWIKKVNKRDGYIKTTVDLTKFNLPVGQYYIEAKMADVEASANIFLGVKNLKYKNQIKKYIKTHSYYIKKEKLRLYLSAKGLKRLSKALYASIDLNPKDWRKFYRDFRADLNKLKRKETHLKTSRDVNVFYPRTWKIYGQVHRELIEKGQKLNHKRSTNSRGDVRPLLKKIEKLSFKIASLTSW